PVRAFDAKFPYLTKLRQAARGFASEARVARAQGDGSQAMDRALDAIELGSRVGRGVPLIHNLVGLACSAIGISEAEQCVDMLGADQVRTAGARLERIAAQFPTAADTMRQERLLALNGAREIFQGKVSDRELSSEAEDDAADRAVGRLGSTLYPKRWSYEQLDRNFQRL